jgi:hypothetical protein
MIIEGDKHLYEFLQGEVFPSDANNQKSLMKNTAALISFSYFESMRWKL